ncbi:MAG: metal ABC transporter ATP-binding protein [Chloroflexota bacterium]|nr:metal ABC transporter ATP-binding protein [Chloroflexota bacterium]
MVELAPSAPGHRPPPHPDGEPLVELRDLSTGYERTPVLRNVDFTLRRGEFAGVVGPSGSGKTTLLRAIAGQTRRFAGAIEAKPRAGERALRLGYVPQVEAINWNFPLTVGQAVLLGRWREMGWRPWPRRHDRELLANILDRLGIGHLVDRQIRALSGGQQQRTFLARALIGDPDLLLLDEPTSGVDIKTRHEIMHLLGELNRAGTTILMSTHDLNAVATHLPRLVCVGEGALVADGSPEGVLTPEVLRRTYGADMLVLRRGDAIYVVEHLDEAMDTASEPEETPVPATPVGG